MRYVSVFFILCAFSLLSSFVSAADFVLSSSSQAASHNEKKELLFASLASNDGHRFWSTVNARELDTRPGSDDEKNMAKEAWYELLGFDPFVPYYTAQKIEDAVTDKTKVTVWKFHGKAKFNTSDGKADYVFRHQF